MGGVPEHQPQTGGLTQPGEEGGVIVRDPVFRLRNYAVALPVSYRIAVARSMHIIRVGTTSRKMRDSLDCIRG